MTYYGLHKLWQAVPDKYTLGVGAISYELLSFEDWGPQLQFRILVHGVISKIRHAVIDSFEIIIKLNANFLLC